MGLSPVSILASAPFTVVVELVIPYVGVPAHFKWPASWMARLMVLKLLVLLIILTIALFSSFVLHHAAGEVHLRALVS